MNINDLRHDIDIEKANTDISKVKLKSWLNEKRKVMVGSIWYLAKGGKLFKLKYKLEG